MKIIEVNVNNENKYLNQIANLEVQVLQSLNIGDTIITSGTLQLRTGLPVTLDNIN